MLAGGAAVSAFVKSISSIGCPKKREPGESHLGTNFNMTLKKKKKKKKKKNSSGKPEISVAIFWYSFRGSSSKVESSHRDGPIWYHRKGCSGRGYLGELSDLPGANRSSNLRFSSFDPRTGHGTEKPKHSADSNPAFASVRLLFRGWGAGMLRQAEFAVTCWSQTSYGIARAHAVDGCGIRLWHHRSETQRNDL